jgi:hypothetical protein
MGLFPLGSILIVQTAALASLRTGRWLDLRVNALCRDQRSKRANVLERLKVVDHLNQLAGFSRAEYGHHQVARFRVDGIGRQRVLLRARRKARTSMPVAAGFGTNLHVYPLA